MSTGNRLARLGIEAVVSKAATEQAAWKERGYTGKRVMHREAAMNAERAWQHTGAVADHALRFLDASTDRFAAEAAHQVEVRTGMCLGYVEALALAASDKPDDKDIYQAHGAAEEAVALAEDIQAFVLARVPVHFSSRFLQKRRGT